MIKRYLLIGIISVSVVFLAVALITAKPGIGSRQITPEIVELTAKAPSPATKQGIGEIKASDTNFTKAVLDVQGMSCSGCVNEIKSSLAGVEGVGDVLVDINGGSVEVYYDAKKLKDVGQIASAITGVGYPAALKRTLTRNEIEKQNGFLAARSKLYIAAVGDWEISRNDYEIELAHARNRYEKIYGKDMLTGNQGNALTQRLKSQVVSRLISEGIQMQEIRKSGYKLSPKTVKFEYNEFLSQKGMTPENFRAMIKDTGYDFNYFFKKFENRLTINRYVEENVLSAISNDLEKQQQYSDWYNNARLLAKVVYYDRDLGNIVKSSSNTSSGCGSSCTRK